MRPCRKCKHIMKFHDDAWPLEIGEDVWTELWICPQCGEEDVA